VPNTGQRALGSTLLGAGIAAAVLARVFHALEAVNTSVLGEDARLYALFSGCLFVGATIAKRGQEKKIFVFFLGTTTSFSKRFSLLTYLPMMHLLMLDLVFTTFYLPPFSISFYRVPYYFLYFTA